MTIIHIDTDFVPEPFYDESTRRVLWTALLILAAFCASKLWRALRFVGLLLIVGSMAAVVFTAACVVSLFQLIAAGRSNT